MTGTAKSAEGNAIGGTETGPGKPFVYRGIVIRPTALSRSAKAREIYEAMKDTAALKIRGA